jgi:PHP domain
MMPLLKGAIHLHSTYSDGEFTLAELRELFRAAGCAFACMTDHAEAFDASKLAAYVAECDALSDERFRFIAGLEFGCQERMHVLGYGVTRLLGTTLPEEVIRAVDQFGGVSVIAHPRDAHFPWIEGFTHLPGGIEAWNSKYDGRYAPRPQTFALVQRLRQRKPDLRAFYGQDLHWRKQFRGLFILAGCRSSARDDVLAALARGDFVGSKSGLKLSATRALSGGLLARFGAVHRCSDGMRRVLRGTKKLMERCGARVPVSVKAQLRRLF